jgi:hypothetical protein
MAQYCHVLFERFIPQLMADFDMRRHINYKFEAAIAPPAATPLAIRLFHFADRRDTFSHKTQSR